MAKFRTQSVVKEAEQWFPDKPVEGVCLLSEVSSGLAIKTGDIAKLTSEVLNQLGYIDTLEGGHLVSPGDWIVTGIKGEKYPVKPDIFQASYEPVTDDFDSLVTMDIYSPVGSKVRFTGIGGRSSGEAKEVLTVGGIYTVESTDVHNWETDVYLKEIPGQYFNSVMFKNVDYESDRELDESAKIEKENERKPVKESVEHLIDHLVNDGSYWYSWQANIAMAFKDEWQRAAENGGLPATPEQIHVIANQAAIYFLNNLCYPSKAQFKPKIP